MKPLSHSVRLALLATMAFCLIDAALLTLVSGCKTGSTTAYQTISATETAVLAANKIYLTQVVLGKVATNSVPTVEAAFNDTQLALASAAAFASGGSSAPIPAAAMAKATSFTNTVVSAGGKL